MTSSKKERIFSGIRSTGRLHLGNLATVCELMSSDREVLIMVADLHGLVDGHGSEAKKRELFRSLIGIIEFYGREDCFVYAQSDNHDHLRLYWKLSTMITVASLRTMVNYKVAVNPNLALLSYPVLMAADIAIHDVSTVPVGEDQRQHLELYDRLRLKVNDRLRSLEIPYSVKPLNMEKIKHRIMDLKNVDIKMSKSTVDGQGVIYVDDRPLDIRNKFRRAKSSSLPLSSEHREDSIQNLLNIAKLFWPEGYSCLSKITGKRHLMFKSLLGLGVSYKLLLIKRQIDAVTDEKIDLYRELGLKKSRYYSDRTMSFLDLIWN